MISESDILVRLVVSALLGALVGLERERQNQPAGLRTHIILAVGSTLAMTVSINLAVQFHPDAPNGDPARLAAQVVSGIGFLGAGAIIRYGETVKGLTTATSLWTVAMIGLAVGLGAYIGAIGATALIMVVLTILNRVEKRYIRAYSSRVIHLLVEDRPGLVEEFRGLLTGLDQKILNLNVAKDLADQEATLEVTIRTIEEPNLTPLVEALTAFPGARTFSIRAGP